MTRINVGVDPVKLLDQHLLAEYRELPRVFGLAAERKDLSDIPDNFNLGTGSVKFFYNKLGYLSNRYQLIVNELIRRDYKLTYTDPLPFIKHLHNDWTPSKADTEQLKQRLAWVITNRLKSYRYYRKTISQQEALELINVKSKNKTTMKKTAKKTENRKAVKSATKKTAKKATPAKANLSSLKPEDILNRKQASEFLKISIYAVDQMLLKKELKSLKFADLKKVK